MKLLWYLISTCTIFLILMSSTKTNGVRNFIDQDKIIKLNNNNQILLQKVIMIIILLFFALTIYCIIYI
uniref:Preprotein translocase subunit G n=1 Tax=Ceramothamnion japonicum TaxID=218448 RepID=A0A1C9CD54_CERJP|nr:preprotein translocase subunit G [Ceramium japonicum]AOM66292.1 preprotein translocase subunit G [Ceramium japonicum]